jgi:GlpG protein
MRLVGTLAEEAAARRFADYLLTREIAAEVRPGSGGFGIWIVREDQVPAGRREFDDFVLDPDDARYARADRPAQEIRRRAELIEREHRRRSVRLSADPDAITIRRCPVVYGLIAISVLFALFTDLGRGRYLAPFYFTPPTSRFISERSPDDPAQLRVRRVEGSAGLRPILHGQFWRLFTPMFLHFSVPHLVFNMLALYWFGGMIEIRRGSLVLLVLVLLAAPASFFSQFLWDYLRFGLSRASTPGGMSGVVYALFGYMWMKSEYEPRSGLRIGSSTVLWMFLWLGLCMVGLIPRVANAAHVGGLLLGTLIGVAPHLWTRRG